MCSVPPEAAVKACTALLKQPQGAEVWRVYYRRGNALVMLERYAEAREDYEALLRLQPDHIEARCRHSYVLAQLGKADEAAAGLRELIKQHPRSAPLQSALAFVCLIEGDHESAAVHAAKAMELDADLPEPYYLRASCHEMKERWEDCLRDVDRYLALQPNVGPGRGRDAHLLRARALWKLNKPERAMGDLLVARRLDPSSAEVRLLLVMGYLKIGKQRAAAVAAEELAKSFPDDVQAQDLYVFTLQLNGRLSEALRLARGLLEKFPKSPRPHIRLLQGYMNIGEYRKALEHGEKALELDPDWVEVLARVAALLSTCQEEGVRDGRRARSLALKACELSKWKHPTALLSLATAYAECGEFAEAERMLAKVMDDPEFPAADRETAREFTAQVKEKKPIRFVPPAAER
jgi:tetratricopeptide (TPR) repeat protein